MATKRVSSPPSSCEENSDCNDGECNQAPEGHSECECLPGFVGPHCTFRDPCISEGQLLCQNGSTCKRMNNLSYECKCRPPYVGEFCTDYDLCDIDVDECMEDLKTDNDAPFCHPCIEGAKCTKVGNGVYTCDCNMELNPSGCFAKEYLNDLETVENVTKAKADVTTTTIRNTWPTKKNNFTTENISVDFPRQGIGRQLSLNRPTTQRGTGSSSDFWNPIIPTIAITSCALYIILLIIFLVLVCKRRRHPRLIVCCGNVRYFDYFSYYLISVETGSRCCAGTRANVYCFLHGEYDIAGPYPLFDSKLAKRHTLQRGQEDNFLVSHTKDLGRVTKIVIWYDNPKRKASSWYCDQITVRDVKAEVNWLFYISTRFHSRDKRRTHEFPAATTEHVRKRSAVKFNARHYFYQLLRYHVFLAPFAFLTLERLTLMFTEWLGYMFVLIALYGFISQNDSDRTFNAAYTFRLLVLENGSIAGFAIFFVGFALLILILIIYWSDRRVPTLIIWRNKPTAVGGAVNHKPPVPPRPPSLPLKLTLATDTTGLNPKPAAQALSSDSGIQVFRIPSTNVTKTEDWVETRMKRGDEDLANLYKDSRHLLGLGLNDNDTILEYGLTGALTDGRQLEPNRFVYTTNSNDDSRDFRAKLEKDVRLIYATTPVTTQKPEESNSVSNVSSTDTDISMLFAPMERNQNNKEDLAGGDYHRTEEKRVTLYFEFCEMGLDRCWRRWGIVSIIVCWILCISIIITATLISCIYGGRYGFQRTFDWIISLTICLAQDFFIYQLLKTLLIVGTVTTCMKLGAWPSLEAFKLSERFQVYYLNGLGVLPDKVKMQYFEYLPNDWESTKHVVISPENKLSRFDKHNEL